MAFYPFQEAEMRSSGRPAPGRPPQGGPENHLLSLAQVAELLKLDVAAVERMAQRGTLPGTRTTGQWLFPRPLLERWMADEARRQEQRNGQRSIAQKMQGLERAQPMGTSTESYDLSIIDELDLPDV